ncbi:MAG: DUF5305 domain-containing protein [Peptoanaerobacter stomatis]
MKNIDKDKNTEQVQNNEQVQKSEDVSKNLENEEKKKDKKIAINKKLKIFLYILGVISLIVGGVITAIKSIPHEEDKDVSLYSYNITTDSHYKVYLLNNSIFDKEYLDEDLLYPDILTDYVHIDFKSEAILTKQLMLSGEYSVSGVIEGYQANGEEKKKIYEKNYPIDSKKIQAVQTDHMTIDKSVKIKLSEYRLYAEQIEYMLGGTTAKNFYILFKGKFNLDSEEKEFSYKISVPISGEKFYEIKKDETDVNKGDITEKTTEKVSPEIKSYIAYPAVSLLGLILLIFLKFFTRDIVGQELWVARVSAIMRKYRSRMICVEEIPNLSEKTALKVKDIVDLLSLSEEIREPVLYSIDESGLPEEGKFYILSKEYMYIFSLNITIQ